MKLHDIRATDLLLDWLHARYPGYTFQYTEDSTRILYRRTPYPEDRWTRMEGYTLSDQRHWADRWEAEGRPVDGEGQAPRYGY